MQRSSALLANQGHVEAMMSKVTLPLMPVLFTFPSDPKWFDDLHSGGRADSRGK